AEDEQGTAPPATDRKGPPCPGGRTPPHDAERLPAGERFSGRPAGPGRPGSLRAAARALAGVLPGPRRPAAPDPRPPKTAHGSERFRWKRNLPPSVARCRSKRPTNWRPSIAARRR